MKSLGTLAVVIALFVLAGPLNNSPAVWAADTPTPKPTQAKKGAPPCPVSGKPADPDVFVAHKGGKVFFDSAESKAAYEKSPTKYTVQANYQLFLTGQARQVACPILGKPLRGTNFRVGGIYVCCGGCQRKLAAATPQQQAAAVFGTAFDKSFAVTKSQ
jgi:hypothetical protein